MAKVWGRRADVKTPSGRADRRGTGSVGRRWAVRVTVSLALLGLLTGLFMAEASAQAAGRHDLQQRFVIRGATATNFLSSYSGYILTREQTVAQQRLAAANVSDSDFHDVLDDLGFGPAVLLDSTGHDLDVAPYRADLIGTDLAARYAHLASAVAGHQAVSNVVPSAAQGVPVVAFATPFATPYGQRVLSGGFSLTSQPMGIYLHHILPYSTGVSYLLDGTGQVIASSSDRTGPLTKLSRPLAAALRRGTQGTYVENGTSEGYASIPVASTPWQLVITATAAEIYAPITRASEILPWLFLLAFALTGGALVFLFLRSRERGARADRAARTDALTGLANRRETAAALGRMLADLRRHGIELGLLLIDVDHFKRVNDLHGHATGDLVLSEVATRIEGALRTNDVLGRWGGEEFVVLLPHTRHDQLAVVAERIRRAVTSTPVDVTDGAPLDMTVSIGATEVLPSDAADGALRRVDAALYTAKRTGRDRVVVTDDLAGELSVPAPTG